MLYGHYVAPIVPQIVKTHRTNVIGLPLGSNFRKRMTETAWAVPPGTVLYHILLGAD
jgi:hypothetical protein